MKLKPLTAFVAGYAGISVAIFIPFACLDTVRAGCIAIVISGLTVGPLYAAMFAMKALLDSRAG